MADPKVTVRIGAKDEASAVVKKTQLTFASLGAELSKRFVVTAGDVVNAFRTITSFIGGSVEAFAEAELAAAKLSFSLQKLGPDAERVSQALQAQAAALQSTTAFSDDAIVANQALLATFTQNEAQLKAGTQAAVDFAAATGTDLRTAFLLIGKAAAGNTAALSRYGIVIDESVDGTDKLAQVLEKLNAQFGGQAQAQALTFSGKMEQLKNQFNDTQEIIGGLFVRFTDFIGVLGGGGTALSNVNLTLKAVGDAATDTSGFFATLSQNVQLFVTDVTQGFEAGDRFTASLQAQAVASQEAAAAAEVLAAARAQATADAAAVAAEEKKVADALKLLGVQSIETADALRLGLLQALIVLKGELATGKIAPEAYAVALEALRVKLGELDPSVKALADALKLLGVQSAVEVETGVAKVNAALALAKAAFDVGTISATAYAQAQRNAAEALVALGDKVATTNARIASTAAEAIAAQEELAASFRDAADAAEEFGDAAEASGDQASQAAIGWASFESARSSDSRTDVQIAEDNLEAIQMLGPFAAVGTSISAESGARRRLAAARAAESAGANGAGSTAPLASSSTGRLGGGTRSLNGATPRIR